MSKIAKILVAIAVLVFLWIASGIILAASADTMRLTDRQVTELYSSPFSRENVSIMRFTDGKATCYVSYAKQGSTGATISTSISCLK